MKPYNATSIEKTAGRNVEVRSPRYRSFTVTTGSATVAEYSGIDLTPEMIYRFREDAFKEAYKAKGTSPNEWGDETVWEGDDLLAVIQFHLAGSGSGDPVSGPWSTVYIYEWDGAREAGEKHYPSEDSKSVARHREVMSAGYDALDPDPGPDDEDEDDDDQDDD
jgi:hypothetical protein